MRETDVDSSKVKNFLIKWRIQIIPYGPTHNELSLKIEEINPNYDKAIVSRTLKIRNLIEKEDPRIRQELINTLASLQSQQIKYSLNLNSLADTLLHKSKVTNERLKNDLISIQSLASSMINPNDLDAQIEMWHTVRLKILRVNFEK